MNLEATNERKLRHLRHIESDPQSDRRRYYFDALRLKHRALPEINLREVDTSLKLLGRSLSFPLLISSMTGGDHDQLRQINQNLARAAEHCGVALAVGSQRVMFEQAAARTSFELRPLAPNTLLFANLGAVQLNYGFTIQQCREAVATVDADALYLHLNPLQEAVQPAGNCDFKGLAAKIGTIASSLEQPLVVKEVGAGMAFEDGELLLEYGVHYIDVAGSGGTSWSRIEHHSLLESGGGDLGLRFQDWGIPTPDALRALAPLRDEATLIASGGLRSGIDMVKAMALGASLCGMALPFLKPAMESAEAVVEVIEKLRREFTTAMFLLGISKVESLIGRDSLILADYSH